MKYWKETREIAVLTKKDFPQVEDTVYQLAAAEVRLDGSDVPQELIIRIVKPNFVDDKWTVSDGGKPFNVSMDDEQFRERVHAREVGFYDGDLYKVRMITNQSLMVAEY